VRPLGRRSLFIGAAALPVAVLPAPTVAKPDPRVAELMAENSRLAAIIVEELARVGDLRRTVERLNGALHRLGAQARWAANDADLADTAANDPDPAAS